jgi:serine protease Do
MVKQDSLTPAAVVSTLILFLFIGLAAGRWVEIPIAGIGSATPPTVLPPLASAGRGDFVALAKKIGPTVVQIATIQTSQSSSADPFGGEEAYDSLDDLWRRRFGPPAPGRRQRQGPSRRQGLGAGFLIDKDGTILTNNHVVDNADKLMVKLDDQTALPGKILGRDPKTDIAVIKIQTNTALPVAPLGDSDRLAVGEWVAAVGSPFGLDNSITAGIVSAKGRAIGVGPYEDFIQTDASINPGNSGGPLVDMHGYVVGINTAIFSRSGGNIGIGFAISINLVKELLTELRSKGKVARGWLGVAVQPMTADLAASLQLTRTHGALITSVNQSGPAARAGIRVGDVIRSYDGREVIESSRLPIFVARTPAGKTVSLGIVRDGKEVILKATIHALKDEEIAAAQPQTQKIGVRVEPVTTQMAQTRGLDRPQGVVVSAIDPLSAAADAGLLEEDLILEIDRRPVQTVAEFDQAINKWWLRKKSLLVLVRRGADNLFLALSPRG